MFFFCFFLLLKMSSKHFHTRTPHTNVDPLDSPVQWRSSTGHWTQHLWSKILPSRSADHNSHESQRRPPLVTTRTARLSLLSRAVALHVAPVGTILVLTGFKREDVFYFVLFVFIFCWALCVFSSFRNWFSTTILFIFKTTKPRIFRNVTMSLHCVAIHIYTQRHRRPLCAQIAKAKAKSNTQSKLIADRKELTRKPEISQEYLLAPVWRTLHPPPHPPPVWL